MAGARGLVVARTAALPAGLDALERAARAEGFAFLDRGRREWEDGTNRYARPGEALLAARLDGRLVGIAGLNVDPYAAPAPGAPPVGRLRHLYVLPDARRGGVGAALVAAALAHAAGVFPVVRLRTPRGAAGDAAARFYRAQGFAPLRGDATATHAIHLGPNAPPGAG